VCNRTKPRTHPTKHFKSLLQKKFSQLIQLRTGHAFIGQYYRQFIPTETINCCCGELIETRLHILQECPLYEEWWHLLNNDENQFNLADILGTDDGATKVSSFLEASGAYEKKLRNETEVEQDEYDDPQWYGTNHFQDLTLVMESEAVWRCMWGPLGGCLELLGWRQMSGLQDEDKLLLYSYFYVFVPSRPLPLVLSWAASSLQAKYQEFHHPSSVWQERQCLWAPLLTQAPLPPRAALCVPSTPIHHSYHPILALLL